MNADEFMQQFSGEAYELLVRISWCWTKESGPFPQLDEGGLCHAKARFDRAVDLRTGELVGKGLFNWLEWLTPKHRLGHPYGYAFEQGHLYRVLVREAPADTEDEYRYYLVDQLIESGVHEPRLDPYLEFASTYNSEEVDRYLLIEDGASGWVNVFAYRRASVRYLAVASGTSDQPYTCTGRMMWMEKARGESLATKFDKLAVYQVRVREGRDDPSALMLVKVLRKLRDPRFDAIREEFLKPVELTSPLGTFVLDRHYDWFEGSIDYLDESCSVILQVEDGSTDASAAMSRLQELCADLPAVDRAAREYAAHELLENAVDWCEEELSSEQFMSRMTSPSLTVNTDGSVDFMFEDGGMFWGHVILVCMEPDGTFSCADIEG